MMAQTMREAFEKEHGVPAGCAFRGGNYVWQSHPRTLHPHNELWQAYQVGCSHSGWQDMESAPRDGTPIVVWCSHNADPYCLDDGKRLTTYGAHCEGLLHARDGLNIVEWGGEWDDEDDGHIPDWWFVAGSDFETVGNPVAWLPTTPPALPEPTPNEGR